MPAPWKKGCDNSRQHIKKQRHYSAEKVYPVKGMVFPVVMYGFESWTLKKVEGWRTDAFELWCWRRLLWASWTARWSNQAILKEINPRYSLEGLMLKLRWSEVTESCPTLCDPMDCSPPGSSIRGIFQARILEWVAISFSRRSSQPRNQTRVSCISGRFFTNWAMKKALKKKTKTNLITTK